MSIEFIITLIIVAFISFIAGRHSRYSEEHKKFIWISDSLLLFLQERGHSVEEMKSYIEKRTEKERKKDA